MVSLVTFDKNSEKERKWRAFENIFSVQCEINKVGLFNHKPGKTVAFMNDEMDSFTVKNRMGWKPSEPAVLRATSTE